MHRRTIVRVVLPRTWVPVDTWLSAYEHSAGYDDTPDWPATYAQVESDAVVRERRQAAARRGGAQ